MRTPLLVAAALLFGGCASKLQVFKADGTAAAGVPIRSAVLARVTVTTTYQMNPNVKKNDTNYAGIVKACEPTTAQELKMLPLGAVLYVNFNPAWFGKSEFKVEYNDNGALKSVAMNSDPAATTEAASKLLETVLPFLGKPQVEPSAAPAGVDFEELRKKHCIVKSTEITRVTEQPLE